MDSDNKKRFIAYPGGYSNRKRNNFLRELCEKHNIPCLTTDSQLPVEKSKITITHYEMIKCNKRKLTKIDAQLALMKNDFIQRKLGTICPQVDHTRKEKRFYFCKICKAYHLTSNK